MKNKQREPSSDSKLFNMEDFLNSDWIFKSPTTKSSRQPISGVYSLVKTKNSIVKAILT